MKSYGLKKRIAAMMTVSVLAIWFALPNVANAETLTIEGRHIYTYITVSASSATATISYTEGPGQIYATITGEKRNNLFPTMIGTVPGPRNSGSTPGGVTSSVTAPDGWSFYGANATYEYELSINGTTYKGMIPEHKGL